jgi:hypothetical protein
VPIISFVDTTIVSTLPPTIRRSLPSRPGGLRRRLTNHPNHWVLLTGYDGIKKSFTCWDVGYPPSDSNHTSLLKPGEFDLLNHFGSVAGWR